MRTLSAIMALAKREVIRFFRQKSRVVGAFGTPLVFWFLIGSGIGTSFRSTEMAALENFSYLHYFFPGTLVLILLFTAIFSTISIIEDRQEGFMQGVLVSSASRSSIVLGKLIGGTVLAMLQGVLFLFLLPFLKISLGFTQIVLKNPTPHAPFFCEGERMGKILNCNHAKLRTIKITSVGTYANEA